MADDVEALADRQALREALGFDVREFGGDPVHHRLLVFGRSGMGKTAAAVRAAADLDLDLQEVIAGREKPVGDPSVFLLATESQGLATARLVNPRIRFALCENIAAVRKVIGAAVSGQLADVLGVTRIVVDGLTEVQRQIKDDILAELREAEKSRRIDRTNWFSQDDWGYLHERMRQFYAVLRTIPMDVTCTALEGSLLNEQTKVVHVLPGFEGRKGGECLQFFEAVGRAYRDTTTGPNGEERDEYRVMFTGPARYEVKGCGPIQGWQKPCAAAWIEVLEGRMMSARTTLPRPGRTVSDPSAPAAAAPTNGASARRA